MLICLVGGLKTLFLLLLLVQCEWMASSYSAFGVASDLIVKIMSLRNRFSRPHYYLWAWRYIERLKTTRVLTLTGVNSLPIR